MMKIVGVIRELSGGALFQDVLIMETRENSGEN